MIDDMKDMDIRWIQRFSNYRKALHRLAQAVQIVSSRLDEDGEIDDLLKEGLIQRFEYTHELAWKVMKDFEEYQGYTEIRGSRDAIRKALETGIIEDSVWMDSIEDRNRTSHQYDDETADEISRAIVTEYYPMFVKFEQKMSPLAGDEQRLF